MVAGSLHWIPLQMIVIQLYHRLSVCLQRFQQTPGKPDPFAPSKGDRGEKVISTTTHTHTEGDHVLRRIRINILPYWLYVNL